MAQRGIEIDRSGRTPAGRGLACAARRGLGALTVAAMVLVSACSGDTSASSDTTAGPPAPEPTSYVVPPIAEDAIAEICAAAADIVAVDSEIGATLSPILVLDASEEADRQLIAALATVMPLITRAAGGYDRMAAVLPQSLAVDAKTVGDGTLAFYAAVTAVANMEALMATLQDVGSFPQEMREGAARLDATTRKVCNLSLYNAA